MNSVSPRFSGPNGGTQSFGPLSNDTHVESASIRAEDSGVLCATPLYLYELRKRFSMTYTLRSVATTVRYFWMKMKTYDAIRKKTHGGTGVCPRNDAFTVSPSSRYGATASARFWLCFS